MKTRAICAAIILLVISMLSGCGGGGGDSTPSSPPPSVAQILSDPAYDGDIAQDTSTYAYTVTQNNTQYVFAGLDPVTDTEYRAFLDFPLGGASGVPPDAVIDSAVLDIVVRNISPQPLAGAIPIRVDLVSFQPPTLIGTDFDRTIQPALASTTVQVSQADLGNHVQIDVTSLMVEAQRLGLANFQVRILEDIGIVSPGYITINDTTGTDRGTLAPLLQVTYY